MSSSLEFVFRDRNYEEMKNDDLRDYFVEEVEGNTRIKTVCINGKLYVRKRKVKKSEYQNGLKANECNSWHLMKTSGMFYGDLYLEYIPRALQIGEFFYQLTSSGKKEDIDQVIYSIFFQIVVGLATFYEKGFTHYDLNSGNILITELSQPVTLTAFGFTYQVKYLATIIDFDDYERGMGYPVHFLFSLETLVSDLYYGSCFSEALKDIYMKMSGKKPNYNDITRDPLIKVDFDDRAFLDHLHSKQKGTKKLNIRFPPPLFHIERKETPLMWMEHRRSLTKEEIDEIKVNGFHEACGNQSISFAHIYNRFAEETGGFYHPLDDEIGEMIEEIEDQDRLRAK